MHISNLRTFIGTYTVGTESKGIYALRFNAIADDVQEPKCVVSQKNPSYLHINHLTNTLYAVEESFGNSEEEGGLWTYRIHGKSQTLEALNRIGSLGVGPCFLSLDRWKQTLFTANYHSGSLTSVRLQRDGQLGHVASHIQLTGSSVHPERQRSSHPHAILATRDNRHVLVADLGADQLKVFQFDAQNGMLSSTPIITRFFPPGSGPRHLALHPTRPFLYVIHELASTVTTHRLIGPEVVSPALQTLPVHSPNFTSIADAADIVIDEVNSVLYTSTRQADSLRSFSIDRATGFLTMLYDFSSQGKSPHALALDSSGALLLAANLQTNSVEIFRRQMGGPPRPLKRMTIPSPSAVVLL